jgi:hypothetical protein
MDRSRVREIELLLLEMASTYNLICFLLAFNGPKFMVCAAARRLAITPLRILHAGSQKLTIYFYFSLTVQADYLSSQ